MKKKIYATPDLEYHYENESDVLLISGRNDTLIRDGDIWEFGGVLPC